MTQSQSCRSGRHLIRLPTDRRSNGQCASCSRENEARYRAGLRAARDRLRAVEAALSAAL